MPDPRHIVARTAGSQKDWEEKHRELCKEGREEWKKKEGAEARVETGLKEMDDHFQSVMKAFSDLGASKVVQNNVEEAKEMCEKKGSASKAGKDLKHKKDGVDNKVKGDSKERRKKHI